MRIRRSICLLLVAGGISACNLGRPEVTLTLAPIDTRTPVATAVMQLPTATDVVAASPSASARPSLTATPDPPDKPSATVPAKPTRVHVNTATPTSTRAANPPTLAQRPSPSQPTIVGLETPLDSTAGYEPLPTSDPTELAKRPPTATPPATWTAVPSLPPTRTLGAPKERSPTPDAIGQASPAPSTPLPQLNAPTFTPSPTATRIQPTVALRSDLLQPAIEVIAQPSAFDISGVSAYEYDVGAGQVFRFGDIRLGGGLRLFVQNPLDPGSFLRTDAKGMLHFKAINAAREVEMAYSPFFAGFAAGISGIEQNKNRIVELDWSADGTRFSFRIDPPAGTDTSNAGVWFWQPATNLETDPTYAILRDCPAAHYRACEIVYPSSARHWQTVNVQWSPIPGDNTLLMTVNLPQENRQAIAMAEARRDPNLADFAPPFLRYEYASWNADGQSITVSGRDPGGRVMLGVVDRNLASQQIILDGSRQGLWLRDAVQLPDGRYAALGRYGAPGSGPLALFDGAGNQTSEYIGDAPPEAARWFPDRSAAVLTVRNQQFTVYVDGGIVANDAGLASNPQFSAAPSAQSSIPKAVFAGSEYYPGQQLRVALPYLNLRQEPGLSGGIVGGLVSGDYVAIFAGPHEQDGYRWWRVQTADNSFGWIADKVNGAPTLRQP